MFKSLNFEELELQGPGVSGFKKCKSSHIKLWFLFFRNLNFQELHKSRLKGFTLKGSQLQVGGLLTPGTALEHLHAALWQLVMGTAPQLLASPKAWAWYQQQ